MRTTALRIVDTLSCLLSEIEDEDDDVEDEDEPASFLRSWSSQPFVNFPVNATRVRM